MKHWWGIGVAAMLLAVVTTASGAPQTRAPEEATTSAPQATATSQSASPQATSEAADTPEVPASELDLDLDAPVFGDEAVEALGDDLAAVAERNGLTSEQLTQSLEEDPGVGIDTTGAVFIVEADEAEAAETEETADESFETAELSTSLDETFTLNSKPGSSRTIFLDFDGRTVSGTYWNEDHDVAEGFVSGYSIDSDYDTFSDAELTVIQQVWAAVAEDYAPFDVNVTTEDPGDAAITRTNAADLIYGARALITSGSTFPSSCSSSCAGIAYVGNIDATYEHAKYQNAWIKASLYPSNPPALALIISHEIGHNGGLYHAQGTSTEYYGGHSNWGPIMGAPYTRALTQWTDHSNSAVIRSSSQSGADLTVLASNGLTARSDEAPSSITDAPSVDSSGSATGFITSGSDADVWELGSCPVAASVSVTPAAVGPNLDAKISLLNTLGGVVATNDPTSSQSGSWSAGTLVATGLDATTSGTASGTLYVRVEPTSVSGVYPTYGSLGAYTVSWTCSSFTDVASTHPFAADIEWLASEGISTGYPNGDGTYSFDPASPVLREHMAAFMYRYAHDGTNPESTTAASGFVDVAVSHPFKEHIRWLGVSGISTGYVVSGGKAFDPAAPVMREHMAAFMYRLAGSPDVGDLPTVSPFSDVPTSHPFYKEIVWMSQTGISKGYAQSDGTYAYDPASPVWREHMAVFLHRFDQAGLLPE
ncbi:MAG: S-layer homology domain-containing protein [Aeromicrobium sp.]|uniref:S-layer homology domain-containing protein n=1 Tax=Aeromicrobium sp. TaxID=1871063 RepID=UPI0039E2B9F1